MKPELIGDMESLPYTHQESAESFQSLTKARIFSIIGDNLGTTAKSISDRYYTNDSVDSSHFNAESLLRDFQTMDQLNKDFEGKESNPDKLETDDLIQSIFSLISFSEEIESQNKVVADSMIKSWSEKGLYAVASGNREVAMLMFAKIMQNAS